jgi:hypothetical protein
MDGGEDIESLLRQLTRDHNGVDLVLAIRYNDKESKQSVITVKSAGKKEECQKLVRILWQAVVTREFITDTVEEEEESE